MNGVVKQASKTGEVDIHDLPLPTAQVGRYMNSSGWSGGAGDCRATLPGGPELTRTQLFGSVLWRPPTATHHPIQTHTDL